MDSELASTEDDAHTTTLEGVEAPMLISDRSTASATLFHHHGKLVEWVVKNDGYLHPSVQIAHSFHKGFHAVVAPGRRVLARTRIASCPMPATLSVLNALDATPFSCRGTYFPRGFLRQNLGQPEMIQAFFLMEQFIIGDKSWWAPYIRTLPTLRDVEEWQWEKGEDVEWIEGTNLKIGVAAQVAKWQDMYAVGIRQLKQLKWPNALNGTCTWYVDWRHRQKAINFRETNMDTGNYFGGRQPSSGVEASRPRSLQTLYQRTRLDLPDATARTTKTFASSFQTALPSSFLSWICSTISRARRWNGRHGTASSACRSSRRTTPVKSCAITMGHATTAPCYSRTVSLSPTTHLIMS